MDGKLLVGVGLGVTGLLLFLLGLGSLYTGVARLRYAVRRPTDSRITTVYGVVTEKGTGRSLSGPRSGPDPDYFPEIEYEFEYRGERYSSDSLYYSQANVSTKSRESASQYVEEFEVGEEVSVNVPDGDPEQAYLKTASRKLLLKIYGIYALLVLIGIMVLAFSCVFVYAGVVAAQTGEIVLDRFFDVETTMSGL